MTTTEDVIRLAREAGFQKGRFADVILRLKDGSWINCIERVSRLIALAKAEEREACAKASEQQIERWVDDRARYAASECASAIRARTKETP